MIASTVRKSNILVNLNVNKMCNLMAGIEDCRATRECYNDVSPYGKSIFKNPMKVSNTLKPHKSHKNPMKVSNTLTSQKSHKK